jgi:hypothetical protein
VAAPSAESLWDRTREGVMAAFGQTFNRVPMSLPLDQLAPLPSGGNLRPAPGVGRA